MAIDMNRTTTIALPGQVSSEIWQKTQESSAVMGLARTAARPAAFSASWTSGSTPTSWWS